MFIINTVRCAVVLGVMLSVIGTQLSAQKNLVPGKRRSDVFGKSDYKDYRFFGLQLSGGPTFMATRSNANNPTYTGSYNGRPMDYTFDPAGLPGFFIEAGLAHFPKKRSNISKALKTILISYYDWGIGFKILGGQESTLVNTYTPGGSLMASYTGSGNFYNGYLYGRFSVHKNINFSKKYFLDNGLGINLDYRLLEQGSPTYPVDGGFNFNQGMHSKFVAQLNYTLGFGFRLSRRSIVIPGVQVPILGFYDWRKGCAALKWYNSNYLPILVHVKWIYLFEKKVKGCNTPGSEDDRKRNQEYMQNN
jgi:hypothetical protein